MKTTIQEIPWSNETIAQVAQEEIDNWMSEKYRELGLRLALESFRTDEERKSAVHSMMCVHCGDIGPGANRCQCWNNE